MLFLREWYMHPNGQIPAYEWAFGDVNPPVHAWAALARLQDRPRASTGSATDCSSSARLPQAAAQLHLVGQPQGRRRQATSSRAASSASTTSASSTARSPLPAGGHLEQADGTAWMAFYCLNMLAMALELASDDPAYEDIASKFFEHFVAIADAMNTLGGHRLWDEEDGFYYDAAALPDGAPRRCRSARWSASSRCSPSRCWSRTCSTGCPASSADAVVPRQPPGPRAATSPSPSGPGGGVRRLLAIVRRPQLERVLCATCSTRASSSRPTASASLSRYHRDASLRADGRRRRAPRRLRAGRVDHRACSAATRTGAGPIWFPVNYLLIEALQRYHHFYGDDLQVECPTGSGRLLNLGEVAAELSRRPDRTCSCAAATAGGPATAIDRAVPATTRTGATWSSSTSTSTATRARGLGASHQTGWTALVAKLIEQSGE